MDKTCSVLRICLSILELCYFILTAVANFEPSDHNQYQLQEIKLRSLREVSLSSIRRKPPRCGPTAIRLNLQLTWLYGKWYPVETSESAYSLWMTSLYGNETVKGNHMGNPSCLVIEFKPSAEVNMLDVELAHKDKATKVQATLLGDAWHPGKSKWVISWPNGEDTLTSIVATGRRNGSRYNWMLTTDCDLNGIVSPDWAIFSRQEGLSTDTIKTIKSIVDGIAGLRQTITRKIGASNCTFN